MEKMMVITLADWGMQGEFVLPPNSHSATLHVFDSALLLSENDFIDYYIRPALRQILNSEIDRQLSAQK